MRVAIIDDEKAALNLLSSYISSFAADNNINIEVSAFCNAEEFLQNYNMTYDIVCMDVEMPGLNGIEAAKELRMIDNKVVLMFITNMAQYAIKGYEVEAVDFILKSVSYEDFSMKFHKALRYVERNKDKKITLTTSEGIVNVYISDIYYIEVMRHYLIYHTAIGKFTVRGVLKEVEEKLSAYNFVRSNHCYLVNLKHIKSINGYDMKIADDELKISRSKKNDLMVRFAMYIGGMKL